MLRMPRKVIRKLISTPLQHSLFLKAVLVSLCNASAMFMRLMEQILVDIVWSKCLVYLDVIVAFGGMLCIFRHGLVNLWTVLERLSLTNQKLKPKKWVLQNWGGLLIVLKNCDSPDLDVAYECTICVEGWWEWSIWNAEESIDETSASKIYQ